MMEEILKEIYKEYAQTEAHFSTGYSYVMDDYDFMEAIKEYERKRVSVEPVVMLNFADDEKKIIRECLVDKQYELKRIRQYKFRDEEYCTNKIAVIDGILSKIST